MLDVKDLSVRYGIRSKPSVSGVTFHIDRGEFVLLAGESASGKSTIMQAVCGFIPWIVPAEVSGRIAIEGKEFSDPAEVAGIACMVQQDPETQFCTEVVEDEVAFGPENFRFPPAKIRESVDRALASVGALDLIDRKLATLSGGEKQKVAIASVLAVEPRLVVLDEPTSSLDPHSTAEVVASIQKLRRESAVTAVVIEHRVAEFVGMATRLIAVDGGRVVSDVRSSDPGFKAACDAWSPRPMPPRTPSRKGRALSVQQLSYAVDGKKILDDVTFSVEEGSVVALMGENGAGKTTVLKHIIGLIRPQKGKVSVFGHALDAGRAVDPWVLGKDVGLVFQNPDHQIFESAIDREISFASRNFGLPLKASDDAVEAFERAEGVFKHMHPHCLSFGQKRRLNIVSASSHGPKLLLMDEPFAGQDPENTRKIVQLIADLQSAGKTLVVVTHDIGFAKGFCTDVVMMHEGKIVAAGAPDGLPPSCWKALEAGEET